MEIFLAVLGVLFSIVLSGPAINLVKNTYSRIQRRRWSGKQYRKGNIFRQRYFAFEEWNVAIEVDADGNTHQEFNGKIVNLSKQSIPTFHMPLFSDGNDISVESFQPWARSGRKRLSVILDAWDQRRGEGRLAITHSPPLAPGERRRIRWGFVLPQVFGAGDEYYDWDVEVPYYDMSGNVTFSANWKILYARWDFDNSMHCDPPEIEGSSINWKVMFPQPGTRLHLRLGLADLTKR